MKNIMKKALGLTMALILAIPSCMLAEPIEIEGVADIQLADVPDIPGDGFDIPDLQLDLELEGEPGDILLGEVEMPTPDLPGQGDEGGLPTEGDQPVELELQVEEALPVSVVFETTPEDAVIAVRPAVSGEDPAQEAIPPQEDGSYLLLPGQYTYSATAEGYVGLEGVAFEVVEAELPQYIRVVLEPEEAQPVEDPLEEAPESAPFEQSRTVSDVTVTVRAEAGAFPDGATLSVKRVSRDLRNQASEAIEDVRDEDQNVAASYTFDIKVLDGEGNEIQPAPGYDVEVSFALAEVEDENLEANVYHVTEENDGLTAEKLEAEAEADTVTAITDGFSLYTVEFTYNHLEYVLPGDTSVPMSEILAALNLSGEVTAARVSDKALFNAKQDGGEWIVEALQPFTSTEWMKVTINGIVYKITVTDSLILSVNYIDENGETKTRDAIVLTAGDTTWKGATETNGWYVVNGDLEVDERITVQDDVKLILANVNTLVANKGVTVSTGNTLSVYAQSRITGAGQLLAYSDEAAAIGETDRSGFGAVTVYGGVIVAASKHGAGIGSNTDSAAAGTVSINGSVNIQTSGTTAGISADPVKLTVGDDVYVYSVYDRTTPKNNVVIDKIKGDYPRATTMIFNNEAPEKVAELTSESYYNESPFYNKGNAVREWMEMGGVLKLCNKNMELDADVAQIVLKNNVYGLDLNGLGLIYKKGDHLPIITVGNGAILVLTDSNATKSNSVTAYDPIYGDAKSKSIKGGYITTNKDKSGGAPLYVSDGAVNVTRGGRFGMERGTIVGNLGSGVRLAEQDAYFAMIGGAITGNMANAGSGVYMSAGTFGLHGAPVINDNYASNVYLTAQNKIDINGALDEGASVGVTMQEGVDAVFTTNYGTYNADVSPDTYFDSDATGKKVLKVWNKEPVEAKLGEHQHEYTCQASEDGATITITCANRDCGHEGTAQYSLGFSMPDPYVYGDDVKAADLLDAVALAAFNEAYKVSGYTVTAEDIKFFNQGSGTALGAMPTDPGDYRAELQVKAMGDSGVITISQDYTITRRDVTITGISVMDKTYDGTTDASISGKAALYGVAPGDALTVDGNNARASFIDKDVAVDKPVTIEGYTLVGVKAANYNLVQPTGLKANIGKRELLVTWNYDPAQPLLYDGTVQAPTVAARPARDNVASERGKGLVGDDTCELSVEGGHKDAGSYTATASSPSNPNYRLPTDATLTQDYTIAPRPVKVVWDDATPLVYNGGAQAPTATVTVLNGDTCEPTVSGAKTNAGDGYTATVTGLSNGNYRLPTKAAEPEDYSNLTKTFSIAPKTIELSWGETFFPYDGNSHCPTVTATDLIQGDSCPLTVAEAQTQMGTYTATVNEPTNKNYSLPEDSTKEFIIGKKKVGLTWGSTSFTYDGLAHAPAVTVTGTIDGEPCEAVLKIVKLGDASGQACEAKDVGQYRATVTSLTNNYIPEDNSVLTQDFEIVQRTVALEWSDTSLTYNGKAQKPTATVTNPAGSDICEVTVSGEMKNASDTSYTATAVSLSNDNYTLPEALQERQTSYTIARKPAELLWSNTVMTYNGQVLTPTASVINKESGDTCNVTVSGGQTDAGEYTATATALSNPNYTLPADPTKPFTVNKKTVNLRWESAVYTYDGQDHLPTAEATNLVSGDTCDITVTGAQKNAGTHTATASGLSNANYALPARKTQTFTIGKRTVSLVWSGETSFEYDGEPHAPEATATDLVSGDTCEVTVTKATAAGTYTATATALSNPNYALPSAKTQDYTIEQKVAALQWSNTALTYNGGNQRPTATVTNLISGDSCTVTVSGDQRDAGSDTATATRLSNANYKLPEAATHGFTIGQKVIDLSWSKTALTYNGQVQQPTVRIIGLASNDTCTVTLSGAQKNVGSYTATASALSNANYALPAAVTQAYTIAPKVVGLTWGTTSFTYDGQSHVPAVTATDLFDGDTCAVTVDGAQKDAGRYTATASALSNANYALPSTKTQSFSINRKTVGLDWSNTSFTYDGQSHVPTAVATDLATGDTCVVNVTGAATRAGSYTATASALSNANYALPSEKTQAFTIDRKTVGLTWTNTSLTYNGSSQKPTATATGLVGSDSCSVTVEGPQKDVGSGYTATATKLSNSNYALPEAVAQAFAIAPKTVGLTWSNTSLTYNGQPQQPTVRVTGLASGDTCTVTVIGAQTKAGSYTASASALSNANYALPTTATKEFTIAQKVVGLSWGTTSFTYDGRSHVPTATATGLVSGDTCNVTVTGAATNAGTYTATASKLSNANYALPVSVTKSFNIVAGTTPAPTVTPRPTTSPENTVDPDITVAPTEIIIEDAPTKVTLNKKGTVTLKMNRTLTLKATISPKGAKSTLTWKSSNKNVATVNKKGKVLPVGPGTARITVSTYNGKKASVKVKVVSIPATKVRVTAPARRVKVGKALQLSAKLTPSNSTDSVTWKSSNKKIARVSKTGKVTGIKPGTVTITATASSGKKASVKLKVVKVYATKVRIIAPSKTVKVGKTLQLKAELTPTNASDKLTWKSSYTKVATVNKKGKVTGIKPGTTVITVTTAKGLVASVTITVK